MWKVCSNLDELLHADHLGLWHREGILKAVTDDNHQRQALTVRVWTRRGLYRRRRKKLPYRYWTNIRTKDSSYTYNGLARVQVLYYFDDKGGPESQGDPQSSFSSLSNITHHLINVPLKNTVLLLLLTVWFFIHLFSSNRWDHSGKKWTVFSMADLRIKALVPGDIPSKSTEVIARRYNFAASYLRGPDSLHLAEEPVPRRIQALHVLLRSATLNEIKTRKFSLVCSGKNGGLPLWSCRKVNICSQRLLERYLEGNDDWSVLRRSRWALTRQRFLRQIISHVHF